MYATSRGLPSHRFGARRLSGSGLAHTTDHCDAMAAALTAHFGAPRSGSTRARFRCSAPRQGLDVPVKHFTGAAPCVRGAEAAASYSCTAMRMEYMYLLSDGRGLALLNCACRLKNSSLVCVSELCRDEHVSSYNK